MAKLYKVRKKCMICGGVFYPKYAGSLYCEACKNKKKETVTKLEKKPAKPASKPKVHKKPSKILSKKPAKPAGKPAKASKRKSPKKR